MAINFSKYKTYDDSKGRGNPREWKDNFYDKMSKEQASQVISGQELSPRQILGVGPGAGEDDIKSAFRKLIIKWHPDHNALRQQEAEEMSKKIIAAYTILCS